MTPHESDNISVVLKYFHDGCNSGDLDVLCPFGKRACAAPPSLSRLPDHLNGRRMVEWRATGWGRRSA